MKLRITLELDDSLADPDHETGLTNEGFDAIFDALKSLGDDIETEPVDDGTDFDVPVRR